jgi:hypothetical protein
MRSWTLRIVAGVLVAVLPGALVAEGPQGLPDEEPGILEERELARDRFEVSQASLEDLARRRVEAARLHYQARYQEYLVGRGTLDSLLGAERELARARQPRALPAAVNRQVLEERWRSAWMADRLSRSGYEAGRVKAADHYQALGNRLAVEMHLVQTRPKKK